MRPLFHGDDDHPIFETLRNAPEGEPYSPEQYAELVQAVEDIKAGRAKLIAHEDRHAWLEARRREEAELAAE